MTIPAELSQVARTLTYSGDGGTAKVGIGTTVDITGGLAINGVQVINSTGVWQGSAAGIQGTQGIQGIQGITGTQGTQGIQGSQGIQGTQGIQGILGTQGIQGSQGIQGTQGIQGATGSQGTTGSTGAQGTQGTTGTTGSQGSTGPTGAQGTSGTAVVRAWVNFNGSNLGIRASFNISSISRVGSGTYDINFSSALPDRSYASLLTVTDDGISNRGQNVQGQNDTNNLTNRCRMTIFGGGGSPDSTGVYAAFVR
jgi:hypothetical protein